MIELDIQNRPKTCESFLSLCANSTNTPSESNDSAKSAKRGTHPPVRTNRQSPQPTYRGCEFHRVVPGFCVQTGDWERFDGTGGYSPLYGRNWKDEEGGTVNDFIQNNVRAAHPSYSTINVITDLKLANKR